MATSRVDTVYLVHKSHTDVGYTHDPPVVWDLHRRFIDEALDLCARDADREGDDRFRWTFETTAPLLRWLETAEPARRRLLGDLCRLGRAEVTAMAVNVTPLYDTAELAQSLEPVRWIREELGVPVRHAMNSDVNGQSWPLVDVLLDAGIAAFSMAINVDHGGAPPGRPAAFLWEGPSGRRLPAWAGWSYGMAWQIGIGHSARRLEEAWPAVARHLEGIDLPVPAVMLQLFSGFGDNGPAHPALPAFIREWNARGMPPRLVLATPADWWRAVEPHRAALPVWRGEWTDFWNFGAGSSALETAVNRASRGRLHAADRAAALLEGLGEHPDPPRRAPGGTRARAVEALQLWDEHTWGADCSVGRPDAEDTAAQWHHKAAQAWTARSLSLLLQRDAVAEIGRRVARAPEDALLVFNPSPHARRVSGPVPEWRPGGQRGRADDPAASRHFQDRGGRAPAAWLPPTEVPALGYAVVPAAALRPHAVTPSDAATVECGGFRLVFDTLHGGIRSIRHGESGRELVDARCPWPLHGFVHERPAGDPAGSRERIWSPPPDPEGMGLLRGWHPGWAAERRGPEGVLEHRVERSPVGLRVVQRLAAPGVADLVQTTTLVDGLDEIALESRWRMQDTRAAEATYLVFPFALSGAEVRFDGGGHAVRPERDQIPGACRDFYSVQAWVDVTGTSGGVTLACPDTPLWQFGGFTFGGSREHFSLGEPWLLAWPTNNYWHTNFRASQPGPVHARFVLRPHAAPFDEAAAHRLGAESAFPAVFQHLGEDPTSGRPLPPRGSLLRLPEPPVALLSLRPAGESVLARLLNAGDAPAEAVLGPALLAIRRAAAADGTGAATAVLPVGPGGSLRLPLPARRMATLRLWLERADAARA